jgi:hypothetical protein
MIALIAKKNKRRMIMTYSEIVHTQMLNQQEAQRRMELDRAGYYRHQATTEKRSRIDVALATFAAIISTGFLAKS